MNKNEFYELIEGRKDFNNQTSQQLKEILNKYPSFQAAAILYLLCLKNESDQLFDSELKSVAIRLPDRKKLYDLIYRQKSIANQKFEFENQQTKNIYHLEADETKEKQISLIDRFLASNPGLMERKSESEETSSFTEENDVLKNSVAEPDEMVTETLAMIYFQQKKYDKAMEAFRKLSLKYPEKSVYFATRIEEIEKIKKI